MESKKSYKAIFMNNYYNLAPDVEVWFLYNIPEWLKDGTDYSVALKAPVRETGNQ